VNPGKRLSDLQELDLEIERKTAALEQVEKDLSGNETLERAREELEARKNQFAEVEKEQRASERATDDLVAKAEPHRKRLYGDLRDKPKEVAALKERVEQLDRQIRTQEDTTLELMARVEALQEDVAAQAAMVEALEQEWERKCRELSAEKSRLQAEIGLARTARDGTAASIDPAQVELYETVRTSKQGLAVARIEQGRCQGCRISLSNAVINHARAGDLVQCDSCGRILYLA